MKTLAVSDRGDVLCQMSMSDPRLHLAYRYLLIGSAGELIWASETLFPIFFYPLPSGNATPQIFQCTPRFVDVSSDGDRLLFWKNGFLIEYRFEQ